MKSLQNNSALTKNFKFSDNAFLPKEVIIPLSQEVKSHCRSVVTVGSSVEEGEVIAFPEAEKESFLQKTDNQVRTPIHSSIPGTVTEVVNSICPDGRVQTSVKIKLGGKFTYLGKKLADKNYKELLGTTLKKRIIDAGVINTFVCSKPVSFFNEKDAKNLVVRLFDEDSLRISDSLMTKFYLNEIVEGARILAKAMDISSIVFVGNEQFDFKQLKLGEGVKESFIKIKTNNYPAGSKKELINSYNKINKGKETKLTAKDLFIDTYAAYDVYNAIVYGKPVISRKVFISGNSLYASSFLDVKIGCTLRELVNQLGGFFSDPAQIIINGQICGNSVNSIDFPITKYVKSIEVKSNIKQTDSNVYPCINCGNCRAICPANISPDILYKYMTGRLNLPKEIINSVFLCDDCGLCNTACQSRLPLNQMLEVLKNKLQEDK